MPLRNAVLFSPFIHRDRGTDGSQDSCGATTTGLSAEQLMEHSHPYPTLGRAVLLKSATLRLD
jgi:hypothetical protein